MYAIRSYYVPVILFGEAWYLIQVRKYKDGAKVNGESCLVECGHPIVLWALAPKITPI